MDEEAHCSHNQAMEETVGQLVLLKILVGNTTKYAQLTNPRRDDEARRLFADHRVV
jgi:hypothetical protein